MRKKLETAMPWSYPSCLIGQAKASERDSVVSLDAFLSPLYQTGSVQGDQLPKTRAPFAS